MEKNEKQHRNSPVKRPQGNYQTKNDAFDLMDMHGVQTTDKRLPTSLFLFECPMCHTRCYADNSYQKWIVLIEAKAAGGFQSLQLLGLACEPCHAVMDVHRLDLEEQS